MKRRLHYATAGSPIALCSTESVQITKPLVRNRAYVTCANCNAILGKRSKPRATPKAKVAGLPTTDGPAMTEAKVALGVKKRREPNPDKPRKKKSSREVPGQMSVWDFTEPIERKN